MKLTKIIDLPPSEKNPRNSEGAFLPLKDGRVLFVYTHFLSGFKDDAKAELWALTLNDTDVTEPRCLIPTGEDGANNLMSVSLLRMENADIGLFYLRRKNKTLLEMVVRRSADEGVTWSEPVSVTPREGYFVINNDRVCRLKNGSIIIPAAEHKKMLRSDGSVFFDSRAEAVFFLSEDDGRTFRELSGRCVMPYTNRCMSGLQEPGILQMHDGLLWMWARTDLGGQWEAFSFDSGESWTPVAPSVFTGPLSPMSVLRLSDNRLLAVYNPIPLYNGRADEVDGHWNGGRTPLVMRISTDNGKNWGTTYILEDDPVSGYCYVALLEKSANRVLMAYCAGGKDDDNCLTRTRIAELMLDS